MKFLKHSPALFFALVVVILASLFSNPSFGQTTVMYGLTEEGGTQNKGAIIRFNPATNKDTVVWNFGIGNDATTPYGSLVYDAGNSMFYAMTYFGGTYGAGAIISFNPITNAEHVVWDFGNGTDGSNPWGDLVYDASNGLFYGLTEDGGSNFLGAIISFNPSNNTENVVWSFGSGNDGTHPSGNLVYDASNGMYYATTKQGGTAGKGAIVRFNPITNADSVVWDLGSAADGYNPFGSLIYDATNKLFYGTTEYGGSHDSGAIISFNPITNAENVAWNFGHMMDGCYPEGSLVYDASNGLYYGTTAVGGTYDEGTIFTFNPTGNVENAVWSFAAVIDGNSPRANLTYDGNNQLFYTMTITGGSNTTGAIVRFDPVSNKDTVVWNFGNASDGQMPFLGSLVLYPPIISGINPINNTSQSIDVYPNPTNNLFTITGLYKGQTVELYNYSGQLISSGISENTTMQMDLATRANGVYLVRILNSDGTPANLKEVVKSN